MEKKYSAEVPQQIVNTAPKGILNHGVYEVSEEEMKKLWGEHRGSMEDAPEEPEEWFRIEHKYGYYATDVPMGQWSKDGVVNAIIRDKYRIDEMEAITNNMAAINAVFMQTLVTDGIVAATKYLKESINDANTARFKEMQEWRAMAKKVANEIIKE